MFTRPFRLLINTQFCYYEMDGEMWYGMEGNTITLPRSRQMISQNVKKSSMAPASGICHDLEGYLIKSHK